MPNPDNARSETTRRSFLKATSTAALLTGMASQAHAAPVDGTIRVGLIGCGGRGLGAAVNAMKADPNVRITAMADLFQPSIDRGMRSLKVHSSEQFQVEADHTFTGFDSYKQLLATDVDVVLLASPPHYRPDHMEASVAAGKHIFCEKPVVTENVVG